MTTAQRPRRGGGRRRRVCLCKEATIDYKEVSLLRRMLTDRGRMDSAKKSGNCAKCQRQVRLAIQQARFLGLLPFAGDHIRVTNVISSSQADEEEEERFDSDEYDDDSDDSGTDENETESDDAADDVSQEDEVSDEDSSEDDDATDDDASDDDVAEEVADEDEEDKEA